MKDKIKKLERSIKNSHRVIERAQKRCANTGKNKSLLHMTCYLAGICHRGPITRDGHRYVNPHTSGDKIYLEEIGTYKYIEFKNDQFKDINNTFIVIEEYN
jgi:hypothetical protein